VTSLSESSISGQIFHTDKCKISFICRTRRASSSRLTSGQLVNPKYIKLHFPNSSSLENGFPSCVIRLKGPPMLGLPTDLVIVSCPRVIWGKRKLERDRWSVCFWVGLSQGVEGLTFTLLNFRLFTLKVKVEADTGHREQRSCSPCERLRAATCDIPSARLDLRGFLRELLVLWLTPTAARSRAPCPVC
jgi:hypothetical protein